MNDAGPPHPVERLLPDGVPRELRRFAAYWAIKAAGRTMPSFADIDPVDIPWALSRIYVVRTIDGGADFVYRLAGEDINERYGISLAGRRISELLVPGSAVEVAARWRRVVETPAACYVDSEHPTGSGRLVRGRRVVLPLGPAAGGPADHLLGMTVFETPGAGSGRISDAGALDVRWARLGGGG